jgi:hypothetical protein
MRNDAETDVDVVALLFRCQRLQGWRQRYVNNSTSPFHILT